MVSSFGTAALRVVSWVPATLVVPQSLATWRASTDDLIWVRDSRISLSTSAPLRCCAKSAKSFRSASVCEVAVSGSLAVPVEAASVVASSGSRGVVALPLDWRDSSMTSLNSF